MIKSFKKYLLISFFVILGAIIVFVPAKAMEGLDDLQYPIVELGNCKDKIDCQMFCDKSENMEACIDFGVKNNLIDEQEAKIAKKAIVKIKAGQTPGGCNSKESCESFCQNNIKDLNSCIAFADEIGVSDSELAQAKKIAKALGKGAQLPGGCSGKGSCESYCKDTNHIDECLLFAEAAEILPANEIAEAKKIAVFLKNGQMPGNCKEKSACQSYCSDELNFDECINFAEKAELVSREEIDIARKTGGKGPGGCKSKSTCEEFCNLEENAKMCSDFAVEKGILSEKEMENVKGGVEKISSGLGQIPAEAKADAESCLNSVFGGKLQQVLSGTKQITQKEGEQIGPCFENAVAKFIQQQANQGPQGAGQKMTPPANTNSENQQVPADIQNKIQEEINNKIQEETKKNMPANVPINPEQQGAPCNSEEECRKMFGN